jgi:predicted GNAT family acetyltransferase
MLQTDHYFGIWQDGALVSVAGIHVYSTHYRVAALGNITTHPAHRGRGLAARATAALCQSMRHDMNHMGLNVNAENSAAIACYRSIGFERIAEYGEFMLTARPAH